MQTSCKKNRQSLLKDDLGDSLWGNLNKVAGFIRLLWIMKSFSHEIFIRSLSHTQPLVRWYPRLLIRSWISRQIDSMSSISMRIAERELMSPFNRALKRILCLFSPVIYAVIAFAISTGLIGNIKIALITRWSQHAQIIARGGQLGTLSKLNH